MTPSPAVAPMLVALDPVARHNLAAEAEGAGWRLITHRRQGTDRGLLVVDDLADRGTEACVAAVLAGAGLLVDAGGVPDALADELLDDLSRLGRVIVAREADVPALEIETWRLLHALADGATVAEAARELHLSLRTANRRLAQARDTLGAATRGELLRALRTPGRVPAVR